nr:MAG TPA: hypothetical protein [Caudoviricetes sp.]
MLFSYFHKITYPFFNLYVIIRIDVRLEKRFANYNFL